jgi:hypothetical protein
MERVDAEELGGLEVKMKCTGEPQGVSLYAKSFYVL